MSQKVAIIGYGVEGRSAYRYFAKQGAAITIFDEKKPADTPADATVKIGPFGDLHGYDVVVRSPSVRPDRIHTDGRITSVTQEFMTVFGTDRVIGVTGSKGKSTTASLVYEMLKAAGLRAHLGGNIGVPALDLLELAQADEYIVLELSSFQLWDMTVSPHVAVVLMIEPEHLDIHKNLDEYLEAKANIRRYQTSDDVCYYHPTNQYARRIAEQSEWTDQAYRYAINDHGAVYAKDGQFYARERAICSVYALQIPGVHHIENACAAISAARNFTLDDAAIERGLRAFTGLPHRLKFVAEVDGVKYYDDSIATTPGSAIGALRSFEQPKVLILGGSDKGADFMQLAEEVAGQNIRGVVVIGAMRERILQALQAASVDVQKIHALAGKPTMQVIVGQAASLARPGDVVIMSPACASFDMFKNYKDRGEQFIAAVKRLPESSEAAS